MSAGRGTRSYRQQGRRVPTALLVEDAVVRDAMREAADSLVKASTPQPWSSSKTSNWVARGGGLPAYIQHISQAIAKKRGVPESRAIAIAIGVVKNWAAGRGKVDATTRVAAAKALAEWEALKSRNAAKGAGKVAEAAPSVLDELALLEVAGERLAAVRAAYGEPGMVALLEGDLVEASKVWAPEMRRAASAGGETARMELHDGGQHVGTISSRPAYSRSEPPRWSAQAVNGQSIGGHHRSRAAAVDAVRRHLEEAPARIVAMPTVGKFMVARPSTYGETTYQPFPNEATARHAAGLPASPTVPEVSSRVAALAEMVRFDVGIVATLGRAVEARPATGPFRAG